MIDELFKIKSKQVHLLWSPPKLYILLLLKGDHVSIETVLQICMVLSGL